MRPALKLTLTLLLLLAAGCQSAVLRVASVRPFVDARFEGWVHKGLPEAELDATLRRIHAPRGEGPGSWVYEFTRVAERHERLARATDDPREAHEAWRKAAGYFSLARFPYVSRASEQAAYQRHIAAYLKLAEGFDPPLEVVKIPFEGKEIIGYLRVPEGPPPPIVVFTGGIEAWKSDLDGAIEPMLERGLAVFAFDIPGTGESQWRLSPDNQRVFDAVFAHLRQRQDVDAERLGLYQISFGGYYAMRVGLTHPDVDAIVNVGGPVAHAFTREHIAGLSDPAIDALSHAMGAQPGTPVEALMGEVSRFSLDASGHLRAPRRAPPILAINGSEDALVPIDDLYIVSERGIAQEAWVFEGQGHCAMKAMDVWAERAAGWLHGRLSREPGALQARVEEQAPEGHAPQT